MSTDSAGGIFRNAEGYVLKSYKRFSGFWRAPVSGYKRKKRGRSNLLLSSDAFNQSGKDVDTGVKCQTMRFLLTFEIVQVVRLPMCQRKILKL